MANLHQLLTTSTIILLFSELCNMSLSFTFAQGDKKIINNIPIRFTFIVVTNYDTKPIKVECTHDSGNYIEVLPRKWERIPVPLQTPPPGVTTVCWGRRNNGNCESVLYVEDDDAKKCTPEKCFTIVANSTGVYRRDRHFHAWENLGEFCDERHD